MTSAVRSRRRPGVSSRLDTALGWSTARNAYASRAIRIVLCVLAILIFTGPLITVFSGAFDVNRDPTQLSVLPGNPTLQNYEEAGAKNLWGYFANSLFIAGGALLVQLLVSVFAAYAMARKKFRGQAIVLLLILTTMMLPEEVIAIPLSLVIGDLPVFELNLRGTLLGVILPLGAWGFSIFVMTEFMKEIPVELEEAARVDGAGELRVFAQIILPLCRPALAVIAVFGFNMIWDQYLLPRIVANDPADYTLTVALADLRSDIEVGPGIVLAGALLALVPSLIVYLSLQKSFLRGITTGAVKG
ncbi:carbohydrate ABC transporter permease [Kibdelosporangium phytohabitans]|uniref:Sugar ABC transporter permease n=1 Tax=Kibdelosporangium phytohabitans TaxID=860235 RepID=A0A0N9I8X2_9PSEU|nr:carbohydrate ABC transporter permease [Kibdelosporangium phytohabitans]ALG14787.1 sugar ABC transporter permease [Kibdelosporangium phytohabitans]MBE1471091.1 multiple sugar transport system permease protein [Kibdelosporangium phytohabitans]